MNKTKFIEELSKKINYDEEKCLVINTILEDNFFLSKQSKPKIINDLMEQLNIKNDEAENIYTISIDIIKTGLKHTMMHPFN